MPPSGLVISKLGVQATASDTHVRGLLALKISLPKETIGRTGARWVLFGSTPPNLVSQPTLYPLPLPSSPTSALRTASTLLFLQNSTHPPSPLPTSGRPYIDVSSTTGKVFIVIDSVGSGRRGSFRGKAENAERREWLVCMEFEQPLESDTVEAVSKVLLPLPRCLDNVIRFQILPPSSSKTTASEVGILTEPKMLPLPPSAFDSEQKDRSGVGAEEGWEDGEDLTDEEDEDKDEGSSWLEGRFQSTDILRLEWSFTSTLLDPSTSYLVITPVWADPPSIQIDFTAIAPGSNTVVPIEVDVPEGWAWADLSVQGDGLAYWRGIDGNWDEDDQDRTIDEDHEDSFATVRPDRRSRQPLFQSPAASGVLPPPQAGGSSASLMRQTLPTVEAVDDFSFEMSGEQSPGPKRPSSALGSRLSPVPRPSTPSSFSKQLISPVCEPRSGRIFDLYFQEATDRTFTLQGVLVPTSPLILVSQHLPYPIPLVSFLDSPAQKQCTVKCPNGLYSGETAPSSEPRLIDISSGASFNWCDKAVETSKSTRDGGRIRGYVQVRLRRNVWGIITMAILFTFPRRSDETSFTLLSRGTNVRITRATLDGLPVARCMYDWGDRTEIRVARNYGRDAGLVEIVLEISGREIGVPSFEGGGDGIVEICGDGWEDVRSNIKTVGLSNSSPTTYTYPISTLSLLLISPPASISTAPPSRTGTLFSFSTFFNLFILWLLLSMGSQVQRLRSEVEFVADEARDLRMYGYQPAARDPHRSVVDDLSVKGTNLPDRSHPLSPAPLDPQIAQDTPVSASRIPSVLNSQHENPGVVSVQDPPGHQGWQMIARHPTVKTLQRGVEWVWKAVVWLILPNS